MKSSERKITKSDLIDRLKLIKTVAISRWTSYLKTYDKLLKERKRQLKPNLDKNVRLRHLFISKKLDQFANDIVIFIHDFLQKFHFKQAHTKTPLFCIDCDDSFLIGVYNRLLAKGIKSNDGFLHREFQKNWLFREPIRVSKLKILEFHLSITTLVNMPDFFDETRCDDLYIIATNNNTPLSS